MPKVSIIISIYNIENYVKKSIGSVIGQTEHDIEIILVDDGSTDLSGKICDEYAAMDSRIKVIHKENGGLSSARNAGTGAATSEFIMFLDGDDYLRADAVERCLETMRQYPSDFIQFLYQEVNEGEEPIMNAPTGEIYQAHTQRELFENLYRLGGVAASGVTKFMRRELALRFPFENIRHEDEMWCTRAFQNNLTVTYIPDELYYYVMRKGSIIHSGFNRKKLDLFTVSEARIKALHSLGYDDIASFEFRKLFGTILTLYREAKAAGDKEALRMIREKFVQHKSDIKNSNAVSGRFALIFKLMYVNFLSINIYCLYWEIRGK